ncbi:MAG: type II toxin-antitoxin system VapC family toxin [Caulobacterales bacterium]
MTAVVLDASAALSFLVASQATPASEAFRASAGAIDLIVPSIFSLEMRHALLKLERRAMVGPQALDADLPALERLVTLAPPPSALDFVTLAALARSEGLGLYDATYLALVIDRGCALASRDSVLLEVASRRGLPVCDLR